MGKEQEVQGVATSAGNKRLKWLPTRGEDLKTINLVIQLVYRYLLPFAILFLLWWQNRTLFDFMFQAKAEGLIQNADVVLSIAFPASLAETYGILRIMVRWIFDNNSTLDESLKDN